MEHTKLTELLNKVAQGEVSVEKAALELKSFMVLVRLRNRF